MKKNMRTWTIAWVAVCSINAAGCGTKVDVKTTAGGQTGEGGGGTSSSGTGGGSGTTTPVTDGSSGVGGDGGAATGPGTTYTTAPGYFDVVWDAARNHVFLSGGGDGVVRVLDTKSGAWTSITVGYHAEHMYFDDTLDQVVLSLAAKDHSKYWAVEDQYGYIGVIDAVGLTAATPVPVAFDPWQIVADGAGYAYASGGSGQWSHVIAVNLATGTSVVSKKNVYNLETIRLHPDKTHFYGADILAPSDIERFDFGGGTIDVAYDSPYQGLHPMCGDLRINPAGTTIYTKCGNVFLATNTPASDMTFTGYIEISWRDLAFRPDGKMAYVLPDKTASQSKYEAVVYAVDTETLKTVATYKLAAPAERVLASESGLVLVRGTLGGNPKTEVEVVPYDAL
jgi:hypothetical protein